MAEGVATAVVTEAVKEGGQICFGTIERYISYTTKYKRNISRLEGELKKIEDSTNTISNKISTAKNNAEDIRPDVLGWLQKCEELKSTAIEFLGKTRHFHLSCLCCSCPNLKSRYLASSEAAGLTSELTQHLQEGKFEKVGQEPQLNQLPLLSPEEFNGFGSRTVIMKEVMDGLKNDSISVIGICGMGGIGKTTLVKQVAEEVKRFKLFDDVAFVVVSQSPNVKNIQDDLASRLDLKAIENETNTNRRAELIYKRLMDEEKRTLVILDDMWEELHLRSVGIPVHGDRKGFKIILTSRINQVCNDMKVHRTLAVGILSKEEAWNLFKLSAEISDESISQIAEEVSQECAGLPLAIVTVGKSLRNRKVPAFRDVLRKLRNPSRSNSSKVDEVIYSCIKLSYDYLESDDQRLILLLCSIFPEDYEVQVEDLVRYARGLFDNFESMAEARDRVESIVDELIKCYLLLVGERNKCVKLHDVVRDVCRSIASQAGDVHISLKFDDLHKMFDLIFQRVRLLRLVNNESFWKYSFPSTELVLEETVKEEINFSEGMEELRVLEVNHNTTSLPPSLQYMVNLHTLSLDYCMLHGDFAGLRSLKMLRVLSFFHSIVEMFPAEISELTNLQCLDLRFQLKHPTSLPLGTLSNLKDIEELYLGDIVSGDVEILEEVRSLSKLHTIQFVSAETSLLEVLLENLNLSKLIRFDIVRRPRNGVIDYQIGENILQLEDSRWNVHLGFYLRKLLNLKELVLEGCDMKYLVDATNLIAECVFSKLEILYIDVATELEELIEGVGTLSGPHEMRQRNLIVRAPFQCPLGNLRELRIYRAYKIKSLLSKSMVSCLGKLEIIEICSCGVFERIVRLQKDDQVDCSEVSEFPKLKHLELRDLPKFSSLRLRSGFHHLETLVMSICLPVEVVFDFEEINAHVSVETEETTPHGRLELLALVRLPKLKHIWRMLPPKGTHVFQNLKKIIVSECSSLRYLLTPTITNMLVHLEEIWLYDNEMMEAIIGRDEFDMPNDGEEILLERLIFHKLKSLVLDRLPSIRKFCCCSPELSLQFPSLSKLEIPEFMVQDFLIRYQISHLTSLTIGDGRRSAELPDRRYLFTPSSAELLLSVREPKLCDKQIEAILGSDEEPGGEDVPKKSASFPELQKLIIRNLQNFRNLCFSPDLNLQLPSLTELQIVNSPVDIIARETHALQNLTTLRIESCDTFGYLFTSLAWQVLVHLQDLLLRSNKSMEAIFGHESSKTIVLPKLRRLQLSGLPKFKMLCCSFNLNLEFPSLTQLRIYSCPMMSKLCDGQLIARQLINVIYIDKEVAVDTFINSWLKDCESMTRCLDCTHWNRACTHFPQNSESSDESEASEASEEE